MKKFTNEDLYEIIVYLKEKLKENKEVSIEILNPDLGESLYCGQSLKIKGLEYKYRSYKDWTDLAQKLFCRLKTPKILSETTISLSFMPLNKKDSFHNSTLDEKEKYGTASTFFNINKNEQPEILLSFLNSLQNVKIGQKKRVLNLGVNNGLEFELIKKTLENFKEIEFTGIDYCQSAIKEAKEKFKNDENVNFINYDIKKLDELNLGKFDLIISIGTLQSSNLQFNEIFMQIVQNYLQKDGSMILAFPNCRWLEGEVIYGAKAPNYSFSELSLLFKDAFFCKKYLQQKKFRVTLTGQYYIFLTATSIKKSN